MRSRSVRCAFAVDGFVGHRSETRPEMEHAYCLEGAAGSPHLEGYVELHGECVGSVNNC